MAASAVPGDVPDPDSLADTFSVYDVEVTEENVRYYGEPMDQREEVVRRLAPLFRQRGYRVTLQRETGEFVLVATERSLSVEGIPWTNVLLLGGTILTTLFAGARWYGFDALSDPTQLLAAWPFAVSGVGVLAGPEFGHYALSRYHSVEASLPYFIPIPNVLGTLGAVIRMRDNIPSRKALFDIGVAGPLAGIGATVVVTAIGVTLPPVAVSPGTLIADVELGFPLLVQGIAALLGEPLRYGNGLIVNPVVIGGWGGAFVTFLHLLPVGPHGSAHATRGVVGEYISPLLKLGPGVPFCVSGLYFFFACRTGATLWVLWGILTLLFSRAGNATPVDESSVGRKRQVVAVLTLLVGVLCFTPVPIVLSV